MESVVTGNDMWMHHFTLKKKETLRAKEFEVVNLLEKLWCLYVKGIIHVEFMPWDITVTHCDSYLQEETWTCRKV